MGWPARVRDELDFFDREPGIDIDNVVALRDMLEAHGSLLIDRVSRRQIREAIEFFDEDDEIDGSNVVEIADLLRRVLLEAQFRDVHKRRR